MVKKTLLGLMATINLLVSILVGYTMFRFSVHGIGQELTSNMNSADWLIAAFFRVFMSGSVALVVSFSMYLVNVLIYKLISKDSEDILPLRFVQGIFVIIMIFSIIGAIKLFIVKPHL